MKRMMPLFMAVVFSLSMAGFALAADEIPIASVEEAPLVEEAVQTPVADKAEKKAKKKSTKKTAKKIKKKKEAVPAAPAK